MATTTITSLINPLPSKPRTYHDPTGLIPPHIIQPPPRAEHGSPSASQSALEQSYAHGSSLLSKNPTLLQQPRRISLHGSPLTHSLAPLLQNSLFCSSSIPWTYSPLETTSLETLEASLSDPACIGAAVTMPLKIPALSLCDALSPEARACGAINTIYLREPAPQEGSRRIKVGANTDVIGIREALLRGAEAFRPGWAAELRSGRKKTTTTRTRIGMVVGGGGAARTAVYALWRWLGCGLVYVVCREDEEVRALLAWFASARREALARGERADDVFSAELVHVRSVQQARRWEAPSLVVGTVPDFQPRSDGEKMAREIVVEFLTRGGRDEEMEVEDEEKGLVLEMCYHPRAETGFYKLCEGAGWRVVPGIEAMVWQGVAQQMLWREQELDGDEVKKARELVLQAVKSRSV